MSKKNRSDQSEAGIDLREPSAVASEPTTAPATNGDAPPKTLETKADKFYRLLSRRLPNALKHLQYVTNLANAAQYDSTPLQREYVVRKVMEAARKLTDAYSGAKASAQTLDIPR
jgi:hypothetical protein